MQREWVLTNISVPAVFGLWTWNFVRASLGEAQALAEHLLDSAENVDNSVYKAFLPTKLWALPCLHKWKFAAAHAELERSIGLCEDSKAAAYLDLSAQDPRVHVTVIRRHGTLVARLSRSGVADLRGGPPITQMHLNIRSVRQLHKR